jgi:hypothetical protein
MVSGEFFEQRRAIRVNPQAYDVALQDKLLEQCIELSGVPLP